MEHLAKLVAETTDPKDMVLTMRKWNENRLLLSKDGGTSLLSPSRHSRLNGTATGVTWEERGYWVSSAVLFSLQGTL